MNIKMFFNLMIAPTRMTWQSSGFLYLSILTPYSYWSSDHLHSLLTITVMVICTLPSQFLLGTLSQCSPHLCSWSNSDSFYVLLLTSLEGSRGRACGALFIKSTEAHSTVIGLHIHSPSLTHPEQLPVLWAPLISAPYRWTIFLSLIL